MYSPSLSSLYSFLPITYHIHPGSQLCTGVNSSMHPSTHLSPRSLHTLSVYHPSNTYTHQSCPSIYAPAHPPVFLISLLQLSDPTTHPSVCSLAEGPSFSFPHPANITQQPLCPQATHPFIHSIPPFSHLPHRHPSLLFGFLLICFLGGRLLWVFVAAHRLLYLKHRLSCPSACGILIP